MFTEELSKKAEAGDVNAQLELAICYHNGYGTTQDDDQALIWWQKAAGQGHEAAPKFIEVLMREHNNRGTYQTD